jgi:hypothetical protein
MNARFTLIRANNSDKLLIWDNQTFGYIGGRGFADRLDAVEYLKGIYGKNAEQLLS